jgi:hypothetical protein
MITRTSSSHGQRLVSNNGYGAPSQPVPQYTSINTPLQPKPVMPEFRPTSQQYGQSRQSYQQYSQPQVTRPSAPMPSMFAPTMIVKNNEYATKVNQAYSSPSDGKQNNASQSTPIVSLVHI